MADPKPEAAPVVISYRRRAQPRKLDDVLLELARVCKADHQDVIQRELARLSTMNEVTCG